MAGPDTWFDQRKAAEVILWKFWGLDFKRSCSFSEPLEAMGGWENPSIGSLSLRIFCSRDKLMPERALEGRCPGLQSHIFKEGEQHCPPPP